jgi:hypothetical protein
MYKKDRSVSPTSPLSGVSVIYYTDDEEAHTRRKNVKDKCPKKNQPKNGKCPDGWDLKLNVHGVPCCHMKPKGKKETSCPVDRRPVDGKCKSGYELQINNHGVPCCYKIPRSILESRILEDDVTSIQQSPVSSKISPILNSGTFRRSTRIPKKYNDK